MGFIPLLLVSVGLAADAFAVSVCKGLQLKKPGNGYCVIVALFFGGFQSIMPLAGYVLGSFFQKSIEKYDHWFVFLLLFTVGANMIREALFEDGVEVEEFHLDIKELIVLSLATSIDAMAIGVTFAILETPIVWAVCMIGAVTFCLCYIGVRLGHILGVRFKKRAEVAGGTILILLGFHTLLEHLGFLIHLLG